MKSLRNLLLPSLTIVGFLLAGTAAKADSLTITLAQPYQTGGSYDTLDFYATITNNSSQTAYLNGDDFTIASPLVLDDSPFDSNFPLTLGAGDSATGLLFTVTIPNLATLGLNEGNFEITGGHYNSNEEYVLGSANFDVVATPEPSSLSLLAIGLFSGLVVLRGSLRRPRINPALIG
jgi:hypothetical protein